MPDSDRNSTPSRINRGADPRKRSGWRTAGLAFGVVACLVFVAAGAIFGNLYWNSAFIREQFGKHAFTTMVNAFHGDPTADWTPDKVFPQKDSMNVLIMGSDHDYNNKDQIVKTTNGRSDSILIAHVDFRSKTISGLTIPRDTAVHIPGHSGIHKINAAHSFGGPDLARETIQSVFGIPIDHYVDLDLEGFQQIVNSLGGIDLNVEVPPGHKGLDYDDNWGNLHIHLKPGFQHLNGYQAMGYVRMRHSDSDFMRSKRQHEFLEALRSKVKQPATFLKVADIVNKVDENLKRDMDNTQLLTLVNFARTLPTGSIELATLPSEEGPAYVTIDSEKSAELIQKMFFPNQQVALNIDAPDPGTVAAMNAPYERGGHHRRASRHSRRRAIHRTEEAPRASIAPTENPPAETHSLSVDTPAPDSAPAPSEPSGGSGGGQSDNPD